MQNAVGQASLAAAKTGRPDRKRSVAFAEKLHEDLFGREEVDERPIHKLISHASVPSIGADAVAWDVDDMKDDEIRDALAALCLRTDSTATTNRMIEGQST